MNQIKFKKKKINMNKTSFWLLVILCMVTIFMLSHQSVDDSHQLSIRLTEKINTVFERLSPHLVFDINLLHHYIRKSAHFFAYFILGVLVMHASRYLGIKGFLRIGIALGFCILFAITDEVHQIFIPGRGAQVKDVIIDSAGASMGIAMYLLSIFAGRKIRGSRGK